MAAVNFVVIEGVGLWSTRLGAPTSGAAAVRCIWCDAAGRVPKGEP